MHPAGRSTAASDRVRRSPRGSSAGLLSRCWVQPARRAGSDIAAEMSDFSIGRGNTCGIYFGVLEVLMSRRVSWVGSVVAQVSVSPSSEGLPAAQFWQQLLNWLGWGALACSLASLLVGAAVWGLSHVNGNSVYSTRGKAFATGGVIGALLTGMAAGLINSLYASAGN